MPDTPPDEPERDSSRLASEIADHLIEHPEDLEVMSLKLQVALIQEQIKALTVEVHQHWP